MIINLFRSVFSVSGVNQKHEEKINTGLLQTQWMNYPVFSVSGVNQKHEEKINTGLLHTQWIIHPLGLKKSCINFFLRVFGSHQN